jgi:hypothetical protein
MGSENGDYPQNYPKLQFYKWRITLQMMQNHGDLEI